MNILLLNQMLETTIEMNINPILSMHQWKEDNEKYRNRILLLNIMKMTTSNTIATIDIRP